jgi:hypothetical protein
MEPDKVHLVLAIHGMWGNDVREFRLFLSHLTLIQSHLAEAERIMKEKASQRITGDQVDILVAKTNKGASTYDGIDHGAERIVEEVREVFVSDINSSTYPFLSDLSTDRRH